MIELVKNLRARLTEYRYSRRDSIVNIHINAIDIVVNLVEYWIEEKRPIAVNEQKWFDAGYQLSYLLSGSDWEHLSDLYSNLVIEVKQQNYFN